MQKQIAKVGQIFSVMADCQERTDLPQRYRFKTAERIANVELICHDMTRLPKEERFAK